MWKSALFIIVCSLAWGTAGVVLAVIVLFLINAFKLEEEPSLEGHKETKHDSAKHSELKATFKASIKQIYLVSTALAKMAKVDGAITPEQIKMTMQYLRKFDFNDSEIKLAQTVFQQEKDSDLSFNDIIPLFNTSFQDIENAQSSLFDGLFTVALANGYPNQLQINQLLELETLLDMPAGLTMERLRFARNEDEEVYEEPKVENSTETPFTILGLSPSASFKEVKAAYRKKCKELHPDTLASKSLAPELIKFANEQMRACTEAYQTLKAQLT